MTTTTMIPIPTRIPTEDKSIPSAPRSHKAACSLANPAVATTFYKIDLFVCVCNLDVYKVLLFDKSQNPANAATIAAITALGTSLRFSTHVTDDARKFDEAHLKQYRVVVFVNNSGDNLNAQQQAEADGARQADNLEREVNRAAAEAQAAQVQLNARIASATRARDEAKAKTATIASLEALETPTGERSSHAVQPTT